MTHNPQSTPRPSGAPLHASTGAPLHALDVDPSTLPTPAYDAPSSPLDAAYWRGYYDAAFTYADDTTTVDAVVVSRRSTGRRVFYALVVVVVILVAYRVGYWQGASATLDAVRSRLHALDVPCVPVSWLDDARTTIVR